MSASRVANKNLKSEKLSRSAENQSDAYDSEQLAARPHPTVASVRNVK